MIKIPEITETIKVHEITEMSKVPEITETIKVPEITARDLAMTFLETGAAAAMRGPEVIRGIDQAGLREPVTTTGIHHAMMNRFTKATSVIIGEGDIAKEAAECVATIQEIARIGTTKHLEEEDETVMSTLGMA